jgi:hypothetical protein
VYGNAMAKTNAERQAAKRERKLALGLVRIEAWVPLNLRAKALRYLARLLK